MWSPADRRRCIRMSAEGSRLKKEIPEALPDKTKKNRKPVPAWFPVSVEHTGFEPVTSSMPSRRAPNCANAPCPNLIIHDLRQLGNLKFSPLQSPITEPLQSTLTKHFAGHYTGPAPPGIFLQAAGTGLYTADMPWKGLINKYGICIKQKL